MPVRAYAYLSLFLFRHVFPNYEARECAPSAGKSLGITFEREKRSCRDDMRQNALSFVARDDTNDDDHRMTTIAIDRSKPQASAKQTVSAARLSSSTGIDPEDARERERSRLLSFIRSFLFLFITGRESADELSLCLLRLAVFLL